MLGLLIFIFISKGDDGMRYFVGVKKHSHLLCIQKLVHVDLNKDCEIGHFLIILQNLIYMHGS